MNPRVHPRKSQYYIGAFFTVTGFLSIPTILIGIQYAPRSNPYHIPLFLLGGLTLAISTIILGVYISKNALGSARVTGFTLSDTEIKRAELNQKQNFYRRAHADGLMTKKEMTRNLKELEIPKSQTKCSETSRRRVGAILLAPLIKPCVRFSRTRLSEVVPQFAIKLTNLLRPLAILR